MGTIHVPDMRRPRVPRSNAALAQHGTGLPPRRYDVCFQIKDIGVARAAPLFAIGITYFQETPFNDCGGPRVLQCTKNKTRRVAPPGGYAVNLSIDAYCSNGSHPG